jgi:hypothetical protein
MVGLGLVAGNPESVGVRSAFTSSTATAPKALTRKLRHCRTIGARAVASSSPEDVNSPLGPGRLIYAAASLASNSEFRSSICPRQRSCGGRPSAVAREISRGSDVWVERWVSTSELDAMLSVGSRVGKPRDSPRKCDVAVPCEFMCAPRRMYTAAVSSNSDKTLVQAKDSCLYHHAYAR